MRLQVSASGVTVALTLLAGCFGPLMFSDEPRSGWRIFDSAFDGLENAKLVHRTDPHAFDLEWEGSSPYGHKAYYESALRANETIRLSFRAEAGPQVLLTLAHVQDYECADPTTEPLPTNATIDDDWASGYVLHAVGECLFELTFRRDVVAANGVHLVWGATTIAMDARDTGPGGGVPLRFEASRATFTSIQNS